MSEFRMFCIAAFVTGGIVAAINNHFGGGFTGDPGSAMFATMFLGGCLFITLFGKRGPCAQNPSEGD